MTEHHIAINAESFGELCDGSKTFEIRRDDGYAIGDTLTYREHIPVPENSMAFMSPDPTGRTACRRVSHILKGTDWLPQGFVVMALVDAYGPDDKWWKDLHIRSGGR